MESAVIESAAAQTLRDEPLNHGHADRGEDQVR
jgi:hypothetical protein